MLWDALGDQLQGFERVDADKELIAHAEVLVSDVYDVVFRQVVREAAGVDFDKARVGGDAEVGVFDPFLHTRGRSCAVVGAKAQRVLLREHSFPGCHMSVGDLRFVDDRAEELAEPMTVGVLVEEEHWALCLCVKLEETVHRCLEALRIRAWQLNTELLVRYLNFKVRDVGGDLDMHGALLAQTGANRPVDLLDHVHRRDAGDNLSERADGVEHVRKVPIGQRVVQVPTVLGCVLRRCSGN